MADDVLRMRATVSSEEALASIRAIGREFGLLPRVAKPPIDQLSLSLKGLGATAATVGRELRGLVPGLSGFGLGAAGAGAAAYALVRTLSNVSEKIVQLKYRSAELGIAEGALRGFSEAAAKAGISPDAFNASLQRFKRNTEDFKLRIGGVREEMIRMGAGPVIQRINAATTTMEKLKIAYDFKETLNKLDPSGARGRRFFEDMELGADAARLSWEELAKSVKAPLTDKEIADAKKFHDQMVELGATWDIVVQKFGIALFPSATSDLKTLEKVLDYLNSIKSWRDAWDKLPKELFSFKLGDPTRGLRELENLPPPAAIGPNPLKQGVPATGVTGGYMPIAFQGGNVEGFSGAGADLTEGSRMVKEGVFQALIDFQSYVTGGAGPAGSQGAGFQRASFGGFGGAGGAAGAPSVPAWEGGQPSDGTGRRPQGSQLPSGEPTPPTGPGGQPPMGEKAATAVAGPEAKGGMYNYFQKTGAAKPKRSDLKTVDTPYGKIAVHPEAAADFAGFAADLKESGAPIKKFGSYADRQKRWGGGTSSHAYGAALDIDDATSLSPQMKKWITENPERWAEIKKKWNIGQPLTDKSGTGGKDAPHVEWKGPHGSKFVDGKAQAGSDPPASESPEGRQAAAGPTGTGGSAADRASAGGGDPVTAGKGGRVDPAALQARLKGLIGQSGLAGMKPEDAARYGIRTGSAEEWASLMTKMAQKESDFKSGLVGDVGKFGGHGSQGLFQLSPQDAITYGLQKTPFTKEQLADPDFNARMAVKIMERRVAAGGIGGRKGAAAYWAGPGGYLARGGVRADAQTARIDATTAPQVNATGNVNVKITSNGTAAKAEADSDGIFQKSTISNYRQMQPTENPTVLERPG